MSMCNCVCVRMCEYVAGCQTCIHTHTHAPMNIESCSNLTNRKGDKTSFEIILQIHNSSVVK